MRKCCLVHHCRDLLIRVHFYITRAFMLIEGAVLYESAGESEKGHLVHYYGGST